MHSGYREDAVSRACYAILHAAKAALFGHDVAVASHASVRRMFGLHLVRTGEIEREWARCLAAGSDDRLAADYNVHTRFTCDETRYECRQAREFVKRIERYLLDNGFADEDLDSKRIRAEAIAVRCANPPAPCGCVAPSQQPSLRAPVRDKRGRRVPNSRRICETSRFLIYCRIRARPVAGERTARQSARTVTSSPHHRVSAARLGKGQSMG